MKRSFTVVVLFYLISVFAEADFYTPEFVTINHADTNGSTSNPNIKCYFKKALDEGCVTISLSVRKGYLKEGIFTASKDGKTIVSVPFVMQEIDGREVWSIDVNEAIGDHYIISFRKPGGERGVAINFTKLLLTPIEP